MEVSRGGSTEELVGAASSVFGLWIDDVAPSR
jgi:hypothetical protein